MDAEPFRLDDPRDVEATAREMTIHDLVEKLHTLGVGLYPGGYALLPNGRWAHISAFGTTEKEQLTAIVAELMVQGRA